LNSKHSKSNKFLKANNNLTHATTENHKDALYGWLYHRRQSWGLRHPDFGMGVVGSP